MSSRWGWRDQMITLKLPQQLTFELALGPDWQFVEQFKVNNICNKNAMNVSVITVAFTFIMVSGPSA